MSDLENQVSVSHLEMQENLHEWCVDRRGRDQFVVRYMDETEIFFNDAQRNSPESVYRREIWTDGFVQWSPRGTYMTTVHTKGVAIWGGPSFKRLQRFSHPQVNLSLCHALCYVYVL